MFLPYPRVKVSIVGSLRDREVACSASDRQGSYFESCVWRTVSSQLSHHPQEVILAQFSLHVHKGGLNPDSFHFRFFFVAILTQCAESDVKQYLLTHSPPRLTQVAVQSHIRETKSSKCQQCILSLLVLSSNPYSSCRPPSTNIYFRNGSGQRTVHLASLMAKSVFTRRQRPHGHTMLQLRWIDVFAHNVVVTLNQRHWRWLNVATLCTQGQ